MRPGSVPRVMVDHTALPAGEPWSLRCPWCTITTQGGLQGRIAHAATVHPDHLTPRTRP